MLGVTGFELADLARSLCNDNVRSNFDSAQDNRFVFGYQIVSLPVTTGIMRGFSFTKAWADRLEEVGGIGAAHVLQKTFFLVRKLAARPMSSVTSTPRQKPRQGLLAQ